MVYYDEKISVGKEEILVRNVKKVREISLFDAFKLFVISKFLEKPVLIVSKEKRESIGYRYGIPVIGKVYRKEIVRGKIVFKGGVYYKIDPKKLLKRMKEKNIGVGELCRKVGISKRNFYNYLSGQMVSEENYRKMEEILGDIREKSLGEILKPREYRFRIEFSKDVRRAYEMIKKRIQAFILGNKYVDICIKGKKRIIVKIGDENVKKVSRELESEPIIIERPEEIEIVMNY